jgi:hypothetical protein
VRLPPSRSAGQVLCRVWHAGVRCSLLHGHHQLEGNRPLRLASRLFMATRAVKLRTHTMYHHLHLFASSRAVLLATCVLEGTCPNS